MSGSTKTKNGLTEKQEAFTCHYFQEGNAAAAYRHAYDVAENARNEWIYVEACQLLDNPKVAIRLQELRDQAERLSIFTREKALQELEEARALAVNCEMPAAAVSAISGKVKLCGFDKPITVEHTGKEGAPIEIENVPDRDLAKAMALVLTKGANAQQS